MDSIKIEVEKKAIKFTRKPAKQGNYYIFSIPSQFIKEGLIDPEKEYTIYVSETKSSSE
jgi:hypothetical protein